MHRFFAALFIWVLCAGFAMARCDGTDLRPTLSAAQRTELSARVAATPYAEGNRWIARRAGQELHIVGTVHIHDPRLDPVMERLTPVLKRAGLVLVEGTDDDRARMERSTLTQPERMFIMQGPTLPMLLPDALWQELRTAAELRGVPGFMAAKMQPWFLSVLLALPVCAMDSIQSGQLGLDDRVIAMAEDAGVPVRALEPFDTLFRVMGSDPLERQVALLRLGILPEDVLEDMNASTMEAYFDERTAELLELTRFLAQDFVDLTSAEIDALVDEMFDKLLAQRNRAWLPRILAAPDGVTVIAVGAGHLPGEVGILNLLAQQGYVLERVAF